MKRSDYPENWRCPTWHPDFGDPTDELELLRSLAVHLIRAIPTSQVSLEIPEPGLMMLRITVPRGHSAEVHSVPGLTREEGRRFAIFVSPGYPDEIEKYRNSVDETVKVILEHCCRKQ